MHVWTRIAIRATIGQTKSCGNPFRLLQSVCASPVLPRCTGSSFTRSVSTTSSPLVNILGDKLAKGKGDANTSEALAGKTVVGLYFSAHWCPPCRGFTPKLSEIYNNLLKADVKLEIVFVSGDRDERAFDEYFAEQPWLALPFCERKTKEVLSKKFKVSSIPSLVFLDGETGEVIAKDGCSVIMEDPAGKNFPWKPPTLWDALGDEVTKGLNGEVVKVEELQAQANVIGLYFSAHWCSPCRSFTPSLVATYAKLKAARKGFEVIFVSSDRDDESFKEYYAGMPWLAIPNGDERREPLSKLFGVEGIPSLVLIDAATGMTINDDGRGAVAADPEGVEFPWRPKVVNDLASPDGINDSPALCVLLDGCDHLAQDAAKAVLAPIAEAAKAMGDDMLFFVACSGEGAVPQVRKLTNAGSPSSAPQILLLDIPSDGAYYTADVGTPVSVDAVTDFLSRYKDGKLTRQQLS